jgi:uncharacterized protein YjbK
MADMDLSVPIVQNFAALVELSDRIKDKAAYEVVMAAFKDLDDDSDMATYINVTKVTADAGGQLGKDSSVLDNIQAEAKHIVTVFARSFATWRMRRGQDQDQGFRSLDSIEVTKDDVASAKQAVDMTFWVLGLSSVALATTVLKSAEQRAADYRYAAKFASLVTKNRELDAKNTKRKATNSELKAEKAGLMATNAELKARKAELKAKKAELTNKAELAKKAELMVKLAKLKANNAEIKAMIARMKTKRTESERELPLLQIDTDYMYNYQDIHGEGDAPESHLEGAGEYELVNIEADDVVSIVVDLGSDT